MERQAGPARANRFPFDGCAPAQFRVTPVGFSHREGFGPVVLHAWEPNLDVEVRYRPTTLRLLIHAPSRRSPLGTPVVCFDLCAASAALPGLLATVHRYAEGKFFVDEIRRPSYEFVSEPLAALRGTADAVAMSRGEPGLPAGFTWRGSEYRIDAVARAWKSTGTDRGETYLRRHWWELLMRSGDRMVVYCERQTRNRKHPAQRWFLYEIDRSAGHVPAAKPANATGEKR